MGSIETQRPPGLRNREFFADEWHMHPSRIIADGSSGSTWYAAVALPTEPDAWADPRGSDDRVIAFVTLTNRSRGWYIYKDMSEDMGPNEDDCPAKVLDALSPTDSEYALQWRERCRARLDRPKVTVGTRIRLQTADGLEVFELADARRNLFRPVWPGLGLGGPVRIPWWRRSAYEVVTA